MEKNRFDIDKELNQIIFKYSIDKHFPKYKNYVRAVEILKQLYSELKIQNKTIVLISDQKTDIDWVEGNICEEEEKRLLYKREDFVDTIATCDKGVMFVNLSFFHRDEVTLALLERHMDVVSIYNVFEKSNLYFQSVFYDIYGEEYYETYGAALTRDWYFFDINVIFYRHRRLFELSTDVTEKQRYLEKILFDCIYTKDFITLRKYLDMANEKTKGAYVSFSNEIERLLSHIKSELAGKHNKSLLWIWLDALEYGEDVSMPFLLSKNDNSVVFTNAYTVTPYTGVTFKTILTGRRVIEEENFQIPIVTSGNSAFLKLLEEEQYMFKYYGFLKHLKRENKGAYHTIATTISQSYWDVIRDLLQCKKQVGILHTIRHTHYPCVSFGITGEKYIDSVSYRGQQTGAVLDERQIMESRRYVDTQLAFWDDLLPRDMTKIYMSDHGHTQFGRFHTLLKVENPKWKPRYVTSMFSYQNFSQLLSDIIRDGEIRVEDSDYVLVQDCDYYNADHINNLINNSIPDPECHCLFGYQGVITKDDMLIKYNNDVCYFLKHINDETMVTDERLKYLDSLLSKKRIDIWNEDKFEATRLYYQAYQKAMLREKDRMELIRKTVYETFEGLREDDILAIRGGGMHTQRLLMMLPYELRKKVSYIVDNDTNCLASRMGIKVINPSEIDKYDINAVFLSSYHYRDIWRKDLEGKVDSLIDIYEELEKRGIYCEKEFYFLPYKIDDYKG